MPTLRFYLVSVAALAVLCIYAECWAVSLDDPASVRIAQGARMCEQGEGLLKEGKPAEALAIFNEVVRFLPTSPRASEGAYRAVRALRKMGSSVAPGVPVAPLATLAAEAHGKTACVQINQSHEALFENADVADLLMAEGLDVVWSEASLGAPSSKLGEADVLFLKQIFTPIEFSDEEIELLRSYVSEGGSLFVFGSPKLPIVRVAEAFGVTFQDQQVEGPLALTPALAALGDPASVPLPRGPANGTLTAPPETEIIVRGADGLPVAARVRYGKGQAVLLCNDGFGWEIRSRDDTHRDAVKKAYRALLLSLVPEGRQAKAGRGSVRAQVQGEIVEHIGDSMTVRYAKTVEARAHAVIRLLPQVEALVKEVCDPSFDFAGMDVLIIASNGGGYSGGSFIGVQCDGDPGLTVAVIAHEMTHSYVGCFLPSLVGEGLACFVGERVGRALGVRGEAEPERQYWLRPFQQADATGKRFDIGLAESLGPPDPFFHEHMNKLMWMLYDLESQSAKGLIPRFLRIVRVLKGKECPSMQEVLHFLSLASGRDLSEYYRGYGVTYQPPYEVSADELSTKLEAYSAKLDRYQRGLEENRQAKAEHGHLQAALTGTDTWVGDWTLRDSWTGDATSDAWIPDIAEPPANLTYLNLPPDPPAYGLLAMHPKDAQTSAKLSRRYVVPADGGARLHISGLRTGDCESAVMLRIDGSVIWERELPIKLGRFYCSVDLAPYAGRTISLQLDVDPMGSFLGKWVLIDYATIVATGH